MQIIFESNSFSISSTLSEKNTPRIDGVFFSRIKKYCLDKNNSKGDSFELSLVFIGAKRMRALNKSFRKKDYATDILTFTLDKNTGEIFIYPPKAKQKAVDFDRSFSNYLDYLFVHGIAHLLGHDHENEKDSAAMERFEKEICKKFKI